LGSIGKSLKARLLDLPPMSVGIQTIISDSHLPLVGDVRSHPGYELQVVHRLLVAGALAMPIANLALRLHEGEPLQGEKRPDHVLSDPLGLGLRLGPDQAVDIKAGMPPGKDPLAPLLPPLGVTGRTESPGAAGEPNKPLLTAVRTPDPGKAALWVAAVEVALHDLFDDRPGIPVLLLEATLILGQEPVEMMEQHPVENGPLRMPRTIDSLHDRR